MFACLQQKHSNQLGYSYYPTALELLFLSEYLWHAALIDNPAPPYRRLQSKSQKGE